MKKLEGNESELLVVRGFLVQIGHFYLFFWILTKEVYLQFLSLFVHFKQIPLILTFQNVKDKCKKK